VRILIVAATGAEVAPLTAALAPIDAEQPSSLADSPLRERLACYTRGTHAIDVLVTGVGMVATGVWVSRALARARYDLVVNLGVCGSFRRELAPGAVVHVSADRLPEMGAEDGNRFLTIHDLRLLGEHEYPFASGQLRNRTPPVNAALQRLPSVSGITVNTVHGDEASIARIVARVDPDVESMEGAAFMYACLVQDVPFAQVRAVSNIVERRNREAWRLGEAIRALGETALAIIDHA
jgi:futalosine hydrolase